jgi:hypothetical protein
MFFIAEYPGFPADTLLHIEAVIDVDNLDFETLRWSS